MWEKVSLHVVCDFIVCNDDMIMSLNRPGGMGGPKIKIGEGELRGG
jgi:hypothetical protein